jgi:hypothetical protein
MTARSVMDVTTGFAFTEHHPRLRQEETSKDYAAPTSNEPIFCDSEELRDLVDARLQALQISQEELLEALYSHRPLRHPDNSRRDFRLVYKCDHLFGYQFTHRGRTIKVLLNQNANDPNTFFIVSVFDVTSPGPGHTPYNVWIKNWEQRWANLPANLPRYQAATTASPTRRPVLRNNAIQFVPLT